MKKKRSLYNLKNISLSYGKGRKSIQVIRSANLNIPAGVLVGILGATGSGKTSLLNILGGILRPSSGNVIYFDEFSNAIDVNKMNRKKIEIFRKTNIGWIFQNLKLISHLGGRGNLTFPARLMGANKREANNKAGIIAQELGIAKLIGKSPSELSGGQKQLVAIGRALMSSPRVILADEPTSSLDKHTAELIMDILWELVKKKGISIIMVTHDRKIATDYCDFLLECSFDKDPSYGCFVRQLK